MTSRKRHFPDTASMVDIWIQETGTDGLILCFVLILFFFPIMIMKSFQCYHAVLALALKPIRFKLSELEWVDGTWCSCRRPRVSSQNPRGSSQPSIYTSPEDLTPTPSFLSIAHTCTQACVPGKTFAWNNSKHLNVCSIWKTRSIEYCVDWRQWGVKWKQPCHPMKHNIISWWRSRWR